MIAEEKLLLHQLDKKIVLEIEQHRDKLLAGLGAIGDKANKPFEEGHTNVESAVMARMRELAKITGEQHSRMSQIRALKWVRSLLTRDAK